MAVTNGPTYCMSYFVLLIYIVQEIFHTMALCTGSWKAAVSPSDGFKRAATEEPYTASTPTDTRESMSGERRSILAIPDRIRLEPAVGNTGREGVHIYGVNDVEFSGFGAKYSCDSLRHVSWIFLAENVSCKTESTRTCRLFNLKHLIVSGVNLDVFTFFPGNVSNTR